MDAFFEVCVILLLLVANGVFAMAEIALVSSRKAKLRAQADNGNANAKRALQLAESPNRFLSTVQIGITLVGIIAGAYGGTRLSERLAVVVQDVPGVGRYAAPISFGLVVAGITYLSLVIGELVPKRVGLTNPERISGILAGPMSALSVAAKPLVWLLSASTEALLKLLGLKDLPQGSVSEDELRLLAREGLRAGVLYPSESAMVESVLALDKLRVRDLMTPRAKIIWIHEDEPHDRMWHKIVVSGHTTFPVYTDPSRDKVAGVISVKAIYANMAAGVPVRVRDLVTKPLVVPASLNALNLLETFKRSQRHMALVVDEFGNVAGMVTLHDIMEAIVGEFTTADKRLRPTAKQREDGSWLVDAMIPIEEFQTTVKDFPLEPEAERDYETFGGFIVKRMGHVPQEGDSFECGQYVVEIIDMDNLRVDKVLLLRNPKKPSKSA